MADDDERTESGNDGSGQQGRSAKKRSAKKSSAKKSNAKKSSAKKSSAKKSNAKKSNAKKSSAKKSSAKKSSAKKSNADERREDRGRSSEEEQQIATPPRKLSGTDLARRGKKVFLELTGKKPETVSGLTRYGDGWRLSLEVVELRRIPESTDVLATYELDLTEDGELASYRRTERYIRSQISSE